MDQKYCKHCGELIDVGCVVCPKCGKQVEQLDTGTTAQPVIINNNVSSSSSASASASASAVVSQEPVYRGKPINKTTALLLCIFLGGLGAHKFYEGKTGMGILYLFTGGLLGIGWIIDIIAILGKPNPYYV